MHTGRQNSNGSFDRLDQGFFFSVATAPAVYSSPSGGGILNDTRNFQDAPNPLATLDLPAGSYVLSAKAQILGGGSDRSRVILQCQLRSVDGVLHDFQYSEFEASSTLALHTVTTLPSRTVIQVRCKNDSSEFVNAGALKLTAIRLG